MSHEARLACLPSLCTCAYRLNPAAREAVEITAKHPLEPLSALEMKAAFEIVKARFASDPNLPDKLRFPILVLSEPPKQTVLAWKTGDAFPRVAHVEILHNESNRTWVALVDLRQSKLVSLEQMPDGTQPALTDSENIEADAIIRAYRPWQDAMRARGVNPDFAFLDIWAPGDAPLPDEVAAKLPYGQNTRLLRYLTFDRGAKLEAFDPLAPQNPYGRPVEGVVVTVDMNAGAVVHMTDTVVHPISTESGNAPATVAPRPLSSEQPQGSDIDRQGHLVRWHNWQFYVALHPREGLVLYDVRFADRGTLRPIAYRMALSEIYVYYGLGEENWVWRGALDVGEYNAGTLAQALKVNEDIPENAQLLDAVFFSDIGPDGENETGTRDLPATVALYERDAGILWSRTDPSNYARDTRYGRELVVTWNCWIGNYIYGFDWIFKLDGSIEIRVCSRAPRSIAAPTPRPKPRRPRSASTPRGCSWPHPTINTFSTSAWTSTWTVRSITSWRWRSRICQTPASRTRSRPPCSTSSRRAFATLTHSRCAIGTWKAVLRTRSVSQPAMRLSLAAWRFPMRRPISRGSSGLPLPNINCG